MQKLTPNTICLVIDGLHTGYLGAYGNTWLGTPHWDRLASESFLFDAAMVDMPDLARLYRAYWLGVHGAVTGEPAGARTPSLPAQLEAAGVETTLITDDASIAAHPLAAGFGATVQVEPRSRMPGADVFAENQEATELAQYFAQLIALLERQSEPFLLWAHCGSLGRIWDAPQALRQALLDEEGDEDSEPIEVESLFATEPPSRLLSLDFDPDELLGWRRAYAAQVSVLDSCLGALREALAESDWGRRTLLTIIGARGFPLGEHRQLGWYSKNLHEELIHIPWLLRFPDGMSAASRSSALVQPADLAMTLAAWEGLPVSERGRAPAVGQNLLPVVRDEVEAVRDRVLIVADDQQQAIRTPAWLLRKLPTGSAPRELELFVKPDDRWEANEIGDRCPAVAAELEERLQELLQADRMTDPASLTPLGDECLRGPN